MLEMKSNFYQLSLSQLDSTTADKKEHDIKYSSQYAILPKKLVDLYHSRTDSQKSISSGTTHKTLAAQFEKYALKRLDECVRLLKQIKHQKQENEKEELIIRELSKKLKEYQQQINQKDEIARCKQLQILKEQQQLEKLKREQEAKSAQQDSQAQLNATQPIDEAHQTNQDQKQDMKPDQNNAAKLQEVAKTFSLQNNPFNKPDTSGKQSASQQQTAQVGFTFGADQPQSKFAQQPVNNVQFRTFSDNKATGFGFQQGNQPNGFQNTAADPGKLTQFLQAGENPFEGLL